MIMNRWRASENWRHLLAELVVIAVGVGLALTVDNWNELRKERIAEREYLRGIATDLEEAAVSLQSSRDSAINNRAALERLIDIADGAPTPPAPELAQDLILATFLSLPRLQITTVDELVSTGSLNIIRDTEFKRALANLLARYRDRSQWYENYRRIEYTTEIALRGLAPIEARTEGPEALERPEVLARFDAEEVAAALQSNDDIRPILEDSVWTQARVVGVAEDLLHAIAELQEMLAQMELD